MDEPTAADMDGGWKQVIEDFLEEFFRFFFPAVHAGIDFQQGYQYLDKELAKVMVDAEAGDREVDKLIQVHWGRGRGVDSPARGSPSPGRRGFRRADVCV